MAKMVLEMQHITKTFPGVKALDDVSLQAYEGEILSIVGENGAGKSTMQNAICGTWRPDSGSILLNGIDVTRLPEHKRAKYLGRVYQDPMLGTAAAMQIEENLALAFRRGRHRTLMPGIRRAEREEYRRKLTELGLGLENRLTAKAGTLSGGQRQRLAIARALAKKPEVVVFDDSFSALDYKTDARLREELAKNVTDAALVVVAQRIATIMHADQIIVLDDGHVVGTGTHEELLHSCPAYLEIAQSQLSAEELGLTQEEIAAVMEGGER